ncbi:MAG: hypothetical protein NC201_00450 [Prevotella sp.]|nr:hypothetical protein [Bacteroides sp.]MCM1365698.1 hypothetical protein [Prevotella sp.]MCM1436368.1 hypothetical protein [Prevotella sp.]
MSTNHCDERLSPQPEVILTHDDASGIKLGLTGNYPDSDETRFLLTPEACGILIGAGFNIFMEEGAAIDISFSDENYASFGVKIVSRREALQADIVLSYQPLNAADIKLMRNGAMLLCMINHPLFERPVIDALLSKSITLVGLDNMLSHNDEPIFANIIDEVDGRASIMYAEDSLSFLGGGKGVLLAGVAGINPCEILIIGAGNRVAAAAAAGLAAGACVTVMDNDVSMLQCVKDYCSERVHTISIHPRVLLNKVKTADVILLDTCTRPFQFPSNLSVAMKENAYVLDFNETSPSLAVPRTVAMGISNVLVNFFDELVIKGGVDSMIATTPGLQQGIVTYGGTLVDKLIGTFLGLPSVDIQVLLSARN